MQSPAGPSSCTDWGPLTFLSNQPSHCRGTPCGCPRPPTTAPTCRVPRRGTPQGDRDRPQLHQSAVSPVWVPPCGSTLLWTLRGPPWIDPALTLIIPVHPDISEPIQDLVHTWQRSCPNTRAPSQKASQISETPTGERAPSHCRLRARKPQTRTALGHLLQLASAVRKP